MASGTTPAAWDDPRIARGMARQLNLRRELLAAGEKPLGWKLAFGGPAAMQRLNTNVPLVGFLMQSALLPTGSTLSISSWKKPAAEPEIAVHLGKDLAANSDRNTAMAAISALAPAIELADVDHPSHDVEGTLACNIYQRHLILGQSDAARARGNLDGLTCRVLRNGSEIANICGPEAWQTTFQTMTGELTDIVRHVANLLPVFGESLRAGQIIIAGSLIPPLWVAAGEEIVFHFASFDRISVRFAPQAARLV